MFQLVRDMISHDVLLESLVARCLDVSRVLPPNERNLIRMVVDVIHELRDPSEPEESSREANDGESGLRRMPATVRTVRMLPKPTEETSPEEKARGDEMDLRCLTLVIRMFERVNGIFEDNSPLEGILGELITPSVKRKESLLRQKGLVPLGICCLIAWMRHLRVVLSPTFTGRWWTGHGSQVVPAISQPAADGPMLSRSLFSTSCLILSWCTTAISLALEA